MFASLLFVMWRANSAEAEDESRSAGGLAGRADHAIDPRSPGGIQPMPEPIDRFRSYTLGFTVLQASRFRTGQYGEGEEKI
jgi:hypothetical protein